MKWHQFPPLEEAINMTRRQLGPYYQYADPPQASKDMIIKIKKKLREEKRLQDAKRSKNYNDGHVREKYNIVIGRLKAADAMQRIHVVSLKFGLKIDMKLNKMVYVQPTGLMAVRTEYLIRSRPLEYLPGGKLNPASRNHQYYLNLKEKSRLKTLLNEIIL